MAIGSMNEDRVVFGDVIDELMKGQLRWIPALIIPVSVQDPLAWSSGAGVFANLLAQVKMTRGSAKVHASQAVSAHVEMQVSVVEAWNDKPSAQIDDPGLRGAA